MEKGPKKLATRKKKQGSELQEGQDREPKEPEITTVAEVSGTGRGGSRGRGRGWEVHAGLLGMGGSISGDAGAGGEWYIIGRGVWYLLLLHLFTLEVDILLG